MPAYQVERRLSDNHAHALCRLHDQLVTSFTEMAGHIEAADRADCKQREATHHLHEALDAASSARAALQQIADRCGRMAATIR